MSPCHNQAEDWWSLLHLSILCLCWSGIWMGAKLGIAVPAGVLAHHNATPSTGTMLTLKLGMFSWKLFQSAFHERFFHCISDSMATSFCSHPRHIFCTRHDSCAVVACANFCSDTIPINGVTLKPIVHRISITMEKSFVKWAPGCQWFHINDLVQDCSNSSALAMELLQYYTKPLRWCHSVWLSRYFGKY